MYSLLALLEYKSLSTSFEWDLLQKAKQDESEFGLTKQVQEDYLYIYNSVIEDMKRNYNIDPDIKKYLK